MLAVLRRALRRQVLGPCGCKMRRAADSQKKKLFEAERRVLEDLHVPVLRDVEQILQLAAEISNGNRGTLRTELVMEGQEMRYRADEDTLYLPPWSLRPELVIHMLTHRAVNGVFPAHGAEFASAYVDNLRRHVGDECADRMIREFDQLDVMYSIDKRKRQTWRVATYAVNHWPEALAHLTLADPPEILTCQVLDLSRERLKCIEKMRTTWDIVGASHAEVLEEDEIEVPLERLHYFISDKE